MKSCCLVLKRHIISLDQEQKFRSFDNWSNWNLISGQDLLGIVKVKDHFWWTYGLDISYSPGKKKHFHK